MKKSNLNFRALAVLALPLTICMTLMTGCSVVKKLSAADIIQHTQLDFQAVTLDSVMIYPNLFPESKGILPDPKVILFVENLAKGVIEDEIGRVYLTVNVAASNNHKDTLWIKDLKAVLKLDTIATLPVDLKKSMPLIPGKNQIQVQAMMPIDGSLFHLMSVDTLHFEGKLNVSLESGGEIIPLEFSIERFVSDDDKKNLKDQALKYMVDTVVDRWLSQFKRKK